MHAWYAVLLTAYTFIIKHHLRKLYFCIICKLHETNIDEQYYSKIYAKQESKLHKIRVKLFWCKTEVEMTPNKSKIDAKEELKWPQVRVKSILKRSQNDSK
jgi:hypothetical protein